MSNLCPRCDEDMGSRSFDETRTLNTHCDHCKNGDVRIRLYSGEYLEHELWAPRPEGELPDEWTHDGRTYPLLVTDRIGAFYERTESA